jgi:SMODS and SLOG-associating 2TM effector domain
MDMTIEDVRQSIEDQLQRLEDDTDLTSASDFSMAQRWEATNTRLGLIIIIASGVVAAIGAAASLADLQQYQRYFTLSSTVLAAIATVIASVLTFLKPSERSGQYREFGNKQKALRNRIRIYRSVLMKQDPSVERLSEQLVAFGQEKDGLNSDNPPIPRSAFRAASRDMLEKRRRRVKLAGP